MTFVGNIEKHKWSPGPGRRPSVPWWGHGSKHDQRPFLTSEASFPNFSECVDGVRLFWARRSLEKMQVWKSFSRLVLIRTPGSLPDGHQLSVMR